MQIDEVKNRVLKEDKVTCDKCGNDSFILYCHTIIDDTIGFCSKCGSREIQ